MINEIAEDVDLLTCGFSGHFNTGQDLQAKTGSLYRRLNGGRIIMIRYGDAGKPNFQSFMDNALGRKCPVGKSDKILLIDK